MALIRAGRASIDKPGHVDRYTLHVVADLDALLVGMGRAELMDGSPVAIEGTGLFARMLQHETGHLDGFLYLDRLIGRHARAAKRAVKSHGWGVPGLSWLPGEGPDPFGH